MANPKENLKESKFWIFCLIGIAVFFIIKLASPSWTTALFEQGQFAWLNKIVQVPTNQSLGFYLGRMQEVVFGPLTQLISGLLFAVVCLKIFRTASPGKFGLAVFAFLLLTKTEVLLFPPYGDAIGGPFAEALWLAQNSFNYIGLFHQPNFSAGGPQVYLFSIYPTYLAIFLKVIPWTPLFLIIEHLLTFAMTAAIVAILRECFLKNFDKNISILASLLFLFLPLIQSQAEAINMEMPSTFLMVWSAYALIHRKNGLACLLAVLSALVKGTGVSACGAAAIVIFINVWAARETGQKIRLLGWVLLLVSSAVFLVSLKFIFKDAHISEGMVHWGAGWPSLQREFVFYLFLACVILFFVSFLRGYLKARMKEKFYPALVMFLFAGMWFLLFLNFYAVSPRYRVALYPFLLFCVVYAIVFLVRWQTLRLAGLWLGIILALYSSYGIFYGSVPDNDHVMLERSLEYRNDLEVSRRIVKLAEEKYSDWLIVAPFVLVQTLAIPELGYVHKKLEVMIYGFSLAYGGVRNYPGLANLNLRKTVFVGVKVAPLPNDFPYPMGPKDILLEEIEVGNKKATLFMGGIYIDTLWRITHPNIEKSKMR